MKTTPLKLLMLLVMMVMLTDCKNKTAHPEEQSNTAESSTTKTDKDLKLPPGLLDDSLAVMMSREYAKDRGKSLITGTTTADARSIWFSLEKLKLFIANVEASVDTPGSKLKLGIRFYYAKYPSDLSKYPGLSGLSSMVAGMHTLFMTPTYQDKGEDIDFNFEHVGNKLKPVPYGVLLKSKRNSIMGSIGAFEIPPAVDHLRTGSIPRVENHGGLMPPPAGQGSFPTGN